MQHATFLAHDVRLGLKRVKTNEIKVESIKASARALTLCLLFNPILRDFRVVTVHREVDSSNCCNPYFLEMRLKNIKIQFTL